MMQRALNFIRRAVGQNHVVKKFDAMEQTIGKLQQEMRAITAALDRQGANARETLDAVGTKSERTKDHDEIIHRINYTNHNLYLHLKEAMRVRELYYRDMMGALDRIKPIYPDEDVELVTDRPIAIDTDDHQKPWGAAHDNTRSPRFVAACERRFARPLTFMDLGCSGGGLVLDFALRGHRAFGIEGSDHPLKAQRAEWRVLDKSLFTADITRPFRLSARADAAPIQCDVISMWEVLEHIGEADLPRLFDNIRTHLKPDGIFVGSIALVPDDHGGASYHRTVQTREWWENRFSELGFPMLREHGFDFEDFCRGTGNGPIDENYRENPSVGFHFVAHLSAKSEGK